MSLNLSHVILLTIDADHDTQRIDNFLISQLKGVPKSRIYRILRKGEVRVNKKRVRPDHKVVAGDIVRIPPMRISDKTKPTVSVKLDKIAQLEQHILYEDADLLAINKPSKIAVHGGSGLSFGVIEAFRALRPDAKFLELVHRIDRETSGVLLIAKKRSVLRSLHEQLRLKQMRKHYLALVCGSWPASCKCVKASLAKNILQSGERFVKVHAEGKPSETFFKVEERFGWVTLVRASPVTGRTHQIRVHTQHAGHPIAMDDRYGDANFNQKMHSMGLSRLFLHASQIQFMHPQAQYKMTIVAPLDEELTFFLKKLRRQNTFSYGLNQLEIE